MAMRARVFDDWTDRMLRKHPDALVLHIGCGLDSRCRRVKAPYREWVDCDLPDVIEVRKEYFDEAQNYHMRPLDRAFFKLLFTGRLYGKIYRLMELATKKKESANGNLSRGKK